MNIGLSVYGTIFTMGILPQTGRPKIKPIDLLNQAYESGLKGVEMPPSMIRGENLQEIKKHADDLQLFIVVATGGYEPTVLNEAITLAAELGSKTVRTIVGGADYGGDRRKMAGKWQEFLEDVLSGFSISVKTAEKYGIDLAVENHQDLTSEELLWLCETIDSPNFGITLDTGNPLATAEEPIEFAEKVIPYLKHVHLKDYHIYLNHEGYRLVRCPLGQGAIDFHELFRMFNQHCPGITMSIEVAALEARNTRVLEEDYWDEYPERSASQLAKVLRFAQRHAKPVGEWKTPYERGESTETIVSYEESQLLSSIIYIKELEKMHSSATKKEVF